MKNFGPTLIMAVLVLAVGGFAIYEYKKGEGEQSAKAQEDRLFPETDVSFTNIQISDDKTAVLELAKENNAWNLKVPVQDLADETTAESFAEDIGSQKAKLLEVEGTPKWSEYGLEPEKARRVDLTNSAQKKMSILVSTKTAFDGSAYLQYNGKLMLGSSGWSRILSKTATELRNKRFLPTPLNVTALTIESAAHPAVVLMKDKDQWQFGKGVNFPLDKGLVENLINDLKALRAADFASEDQNKKAMADAGLTHPQFRLIATVEDKDHPRLEVAFGIRKGTPDYFVTASNRGQIFRVAKLSAEKLNKSAADLRDRKQPFQFDLEQVKFIDIRTSLMNLEIKKDTTAWVLAQPQPDQQLDSDRLQDFFEKLKALEADAFLGSNPGKGLTKNSVTFRNAQGKEIYRLNWGDEYQKDKNSPPLYYARTSNSKETVGVKTGLLSALPIQTLLKAVEKPAALPSAMTAPSAHP